MSNEEIQFDEETRNILMQGMSIAATQASMGIGGDKELAETRRREQEEFARDMERKNADIQRRRAALVTGGAPEMPASEVEQKPVKRRGKKGMKKQETAAVVKSEFIAPAAQEPHEPIMPAQPIPAQDAELGGLTQADIDLINSIKASHARMRDTFFENRDSVHPGAFDARTPQVSPADEERFRTEYAQPLVMPQQQAPLPQVYQEQQIHNEHMMASVNGQGNQSYGQVGQYDKVSLPHPGPVQVPVGPDGSPRLPVSACMHWRRKWQPTRVFSPGETQG